MHSAVSSGREKVVATLIELGVEVDAVNSGGQTPLHYAVSELAARLHAVAVCHSKGRLERAANGPLASGPPSSVGMTHTRPQ